MANVKLAKASDEFEKTSVELEKANSKRRVSSVNVEQAVASLKRCVTNLKAEWKFQQAACIEFEKASM